jgi:dUTP pyrophosphatase
MLGAAVGVKVHCLSHFKGELPRYETSGASGLDVRASLDQSVIVEPGQRVLIPTGLSLEIPFGYEIQVRPRSGWALKEGMSVLNSPGTIDADYRGELKIILANLGTHNVVIKDQDRIAQIVLCPVVQLQWEPVERLTETQRGQGGFGSTGR